jgi:hypothetical protein
MRERDSCKAQDGGTATLKYALINLAYKDTYINLARDFYPSHPNLSA